METDTRLEEFVYDDQITRNFVAATLLWGVVGMLVGVYIAILLFWPWASFDLPWLTFGRLRPLHTNAVIFAFAGNAIFAGIYYSTQRLLKARMFSDGMSRFHFWGWQAIIVSAAISLPMGFTQTHEYAELEWPIDIAITVVWVVFAINFFGTIYKRRERHMYVAIWFYIATILTVALLHIFNNLAIPAGWMKSYSIYAGVQDAFMQWWYGHNAVAFFLTTPFLGLMYYFMPKAAERPVFSYRLSILHFWSLVFLYIWAGPHHLHYTALPEWANTLGMTFSIMLWMPSWGGMINGLLTLRGVWHKVAEDTILKFFVVAVTFYGMSTFEGPLLSIKSVNALGHYTDWIIAHVHSGALGWNGFMAFGMIYWLAPRIFQTKLWSKKLMDLHFWLGTIGILLYIIAIYVAGITQGLMWRAIDENGFLVHKDFLTTVTQLMPMYYVRAIGGTMYLTGAILASFNIFMTWVNRPKKYDEPIFTAPALQSIKDDTKRPRTPLTDASGINYSGISEGLTYFMRASWHRRWERLPVTFTVFVALAVIVASLFEVIPTFLIKSNVPTIAAVKPYTPLELAGRDLYIREGCVNCHSQMIRPLHAETERYGTYSKPGEFVYDHPFLWGSRRIGPDLHRIGTKAFNYAWHVNHLNNPRTGGGGDNSIMPSYPWLLKNKLDFEVIPRKVRVMATLGVPYTKKDIALAKHHAMWQAERVAQMVAKQGGPAGLQRKEIVAIVAYLIRLGTDVLPGTKQALDGKPFSGKLPKPKAKKQK